jgi:hypothetical protein
VRAPLVVLFLALCAAAASADDPPVVEHQPIPCTIPDRLISVCAHITDDVELAKARAYFRRAGEDYYAYVDMEFGGINYCGTLPAPRAGKVKAIEYYVQAVDNAYQTKRTSTYQMAIQPEGVCEFPPVVDRNAPRTGSITVFATHKKQGKKLDDAFQREGVTFVPIRK